ncbi:MAG: hypothetical protein M3Q07_12280 [Pseudobdellovibrionaceae bacterium]|nr:hypothetical protein [Pseudobdellovibrionaceae bacterium]
MGLEGIHDSYLFPFDHEGSVLYKAMIAAESLWVESTKFKHHDLGRRRHLLLAIHLRLPDMWPLIVSRENFRQYIKRKRAEAIAKGTSFPETIGIRSTEMPKLLLPDRDLFVFEEFPSNLEPAQTITVRRNLAFRSTNQLEFDDVMGFLEEIVQKQMTRRDGQKRVESLQTAARAKQTAQELYETYGSRLTARISSGMKTTFYIKTRSYSWATGIANVGLVYSDRRTKFVSVNPLKRPKNSTLKPLAMVGRVVFYLKED